ncbi:MAG: hypothetical protein K2I69_06220 [Muribaculaceae bacterium]|nr:hypothetical protein [Muribaculaceae bacterium]
MQHSLKLLLNTFASSIRIVVTAIVTIISTRIALEQLGASDFGLFNLVAGIIVMLSFFSGALSISGQRYFSIALGENNNQKLNIYFNSSLGIHIVVALVLSLVLLLSAPFLFDGFLNIAENQQQSAVKVYYILIISSFFTIMTIPFSAMANAYEDLGVLAIIDVVSSILKLVGAYSLASFSDKLLVYALFMLGAVAIKAVLEFIWCHFTYKNISVKAIHFYNKMIWKDMFGFVSWNTLGSLAVVVRNQGIAILLNVYFGTVVNAAYGVANQVNSLILSFASALTTVFAPTIIKSYGSGNLEMTRYTSVLSSKLSFLLSSMMALPIIVFINRILEIWLEDVPSGTTVFTLYVVLCFLILQLYPGLNRAIYATGKIKRYQIILSLMLISVIPVGALLYHLGAPEYSVLIVLLVSQFLTLVLTVNSSGKLLNLNTTNFWIHSVIKPVGLFAFAVIICKGLNIFLELKNLYSIIIASAVIVAVYTCAYYRFILEKIEKEKFDSLLKHIFSKILIR